MSDPQHTAAQDAAFFSEPPAQEATAAEQASQAARAEPAAPESLPAPANDNATALFNTSGDGSLLNNEAQEQQPQPQPQEEQLPEVTSAASAAPSLTSEATAVEDAPPAPTEEEAVPAQQSAASVPDRAQHRQAAPSIGNAAALFGGTDDDFFGSVGGAADDEPSAVTPGPAHSTSTSQRGDFFGSQHTPKQSSLNLPALSAGQPAGHSTITATGAAATPDNDAPASLFGELTAADDDWLGVGGAAPPDAGNTLASTGASDFGSGYDQYAQDQTATTAPEAYDSSSWNSYYGNGQQHQYYEGQQSDAAGQNYDAYGAQYGSYASGDSNTQQDASSYQAGYDASAYAQQGNQQAYDYASQQQGYDYSQQQSYDYSQQQQQGYIYSQQTQQQGAGYDATDAYGNATYSAQDAAAYAQQVDPYAPAANSYAPAANAYAPATDPYGNYANADPYAQPAGPLAPAPPAPTSASTAATSEKSYSYDAPPVTFRSGRKSRGVGYGQQQQQQQQQQQYNAYGAQDGYSQQDAQYGYAEPANGQQQQYDYSQAGVGPSEHQYDYSQGSSGQSENQYGYSQSTKDQQQYDYSQQNSADQSHGSQQSYDVSASQYGQNGSYTQGQDSSYDYAASPVQPVEDPASFFDDRQGESQDTEPAKAIEQEDGLESHADQTAHASWNAYGEEADPEGQPSTASTEEDPESAGPAGQDDQTADSELVQSLDRMALEGEGQSQAEEEADAEPGALPTANEPSGDDSWGAEGAATPTQGTTQLPPEDAAEDPEAGTADASWTPSSAVISQSEAGSGYGYGYEPPTWGNEAASTTEAGDTSNDQTWNSQRYGASQKEPPSAYTPASSANLYGSDSPYGLDTSGQGASENVYDPYAPASQTLGQGQPPRRATGGSAPPPASSADELEGGNSSVPLAPYAAGPYVPSSAPAGTSTRDFSSEQSDGPYGAIYNPAASNFSESTSGIAPFPTSGGYGEDYGSSTSGYAPSGTDPEESFGDDQTYGPASARQSFDHLSAPQSAGPVSPYDRTAGYEPSSIGGDTSINDGYFPRSSSGGIGSGVLPDAAEERRSVRIPCVTFGVDGKVITYFPNASSSSASAAAGAYGEPSSSTQVQVRSLRSLVAPSSYASVFDPTSFPGPVFEGAAGGALSRATGASAGANKAKKAALITYLRTRADEVSQGLKFLSRDSDSASAECQRSTDRAILLKLLALIVEHDGKVTDNPKFDEAARDLLVESTGLPSASPSAFNSTGVHPSGSLPSPSTLATYELTTNFIAELQSKLVRGQRREAVQFALENKMWAHAMVIASGLDKETWCRTVAEFMAFELDQSNTHNESNAKTEQGLVPTKALKTAYSLFSGQAATQVYDTFRPKVSLSTGAVPADAQPAAGWRDSAAAVIANRSAGDSGVLTAMGDGLLLSDFIEAAHVCYLMSPLTSTFGGVDTPGARATLIGGHNPRASVLYLRNLDSILLTEIYEFAHSLQPTVKGQEVFNGLPHLQAFRLVHAMTLAELGDVARAQKYCEAIAATFKSGKPSPYFHPTLLSQLKEFTTRLVGDGTGTGSGTGGWMAKKMQKPTLDGVWGALEGRFTKFIAGEEGGEGSQQSSQPASKAGSQHGAAVGPFSHFSSITAEAAGSATSVPSQPTSRAGSAMDFRMQRAESPAVRAASALSMRGMQPLTSTFPSAPHSAPRDPYSDWPGSGNGQGRLHSNASSTYGGYGADPEDAPTAAQGGSYSSTGAVNPQNTGSFASSRSSDAGAYDGPFRSHGETSNAPWWSQESSANTTTGGTETEAGDSTTRNESAPGDAPYYGYQPHGATTPQFFSNVEPPPGENGDAGASFSSPMDAFSRPASREPSYGNAASTRRFNDFEEDDDDLGLGNSSTKRSKDKSSSGPGAERGAQDDGNSAANAKKEDDSLKPDAGPKKPELRPSASTSSWLGRLWGRSATEAEAKPKKVHLGEEKTFYYDKELKRWINKAAGDTGSAGSTPPPPPPRAQTASPSVQNGRLGPPAPRSSLDHQLNSSSSSGYLRGLGGPPIAEEGEYGGSNSGPPSPSVGRPHGMGGGIGGVPPPPRARSNLGDPSIPAATQPPMRPASAVGGLPPPPPMGGGRGTSTPPMMTNSASANSLSPPPAAGGPPMGGGPPPPPGGAGARAGGAKKKPIKARYVVVD